MRTRSRIGLRTAALTAALILSLPMPGQVPVNPTAARNADVNAARSLTGAGASFVYPVMSKWAAVYRDKYRTEINYQSIGSGGGIKQFIAKTVDFGATDGPMSDDEIRQAGGDALHIPVVLGAVAVTYNLPGLEKPLCFTGDTLARIFLGRITKWHDAAIAADNPGVKLPTADIVVAHRSDGSGTTSIFSDYLSKVSPEWKQTLGTGKSLNWPVGLGGKGNEGVAALVTRTSNAIGYVEVVYAIQTRMAVATIRNHDGQPVAPSVDSVTAAVADMKDIPEDLRVSITDAPGKSAYPIAGMTWVLARSRMDDPAKARALNGFLAWVLSDEAQAMAAPLSYSRLPSGLLEKARAKAAQIK